MNLDTLTTALEHGEIASALEMARSYVAQEKMARTFDGIVIPSLIRHHGLDGNGVFTFKCGRYTLTIVRE